MMKLGRIAGIDVSLHWSFLLLVGWIAMNRLFGEGGVLGAALAVSLILLVFGVVVLHELGHALTARWFGIPTRSITLYPIGGVARLERVPEKPLQEFLVAAAGPAVNLALALALRAAAGWWPPGSVAGMLLEGLVWSNLLLAGFNLLPAFPMDGGRILRAFLASRTDYLRATEQAVRVGRWTALAFGVLGLFHSLTLVLIAAFVWFAGGAELAAVRARYAPWRPWFLNATGPAWTPGLPRDITWARVVSIRRIPPR